jgi:hypothetical protein
MLNQVTARLRKFLGRAREDHGLHAPFCVTTPAAIPCRRFNPSNRRLKPPNRWVHYVIDRYGLQIWNPKRELLLSEE